MSLLLNRRPCEFLGLPQDSFEAFIYDEEIIAETLRKKERRVKKK